MIRLIVDEMRKKWKNPSLPVCRFVASKVVSKFPESFEDRIDSNQILGNGNYSLARQIRARVEHLNRGEVGARIRAKKTSGESSGQFVAKPADSYGCVNFQPDLPQSESLDSITTKKNELKEIWSTSGTQGTGNAVTENLMKATYFLQRQMINAHTPVTVLQDEFPYLLQTKYVLWHFEELVGKNAYETLVKNVKERNGL